MQNHKTSNADVIGYCSMRFPVTDLKQSVEFYCEVLGYQLVSADYSFGEAHVALKNGNGTGHVTMVEMLTNDLLALYERIGQAGAPIDTEPVFTNDFGYFTFYDPNGHFIRAVEEKVNAQ